MFKENCDELEQQPNFLSVN